MNELAEAIRVAPGYKPGMHIQLGSCYGANDAAELAEITGVSVKANSGLVLGIYPLPFPIGFGDWSVAYPSWY